MGPKQFPPPPPPPIYETGKRYSVGTEEDVRERRRHAVECWVWRVRHRGERLAPQAVEEPVHGLLLPVRWSSEQYQLQLHPPGSDLCGGLERWLGMMLDAVLVRSSDGVMLFQGHEWTPADERHWPQTWLCTPTEERGREILQAMVDRSAWQEGRVWRA